MLVSGIFPNPNRNRTERERPRYSAPIKNKGEMEMFFVKRLKPEFSKDEAGIRPNEALEKALKGTTMTWSLT